MNHIRLQCFHNLSYPNCMAMLAAGAMAPDLLISCDSMSGNRPPVRHDTLKTLKP